MSDRLKSETYNTLTSMGYSYALVDKAYKLSSDKSTEGVINYLFSNPELSEGNSEQSLREDYSRPQSQQQKSQSTAADLEVKAQLLLMGYEEYMIDACLQNIRDHKSAENCLNWIENNLHRIPAPQKLVAAKIQTSSRDPGYGTGTSKIQTTSANQPKTLPHTTRAPTQISSGYNPISRGSHQDDKAQGQAPSRVQNPGIRRAPSGTNQNPVATAQSNIKHEVPKTNNTQAPISRTATNPVSSQKLVPPQT